LNGVENSQLILGNAEDKYFIHFIGIFLFLKNI